MEQAIRVGDKVRLVHLLARTARNHPSLSVDDEGIVVHILKAGKDGYNGYVIATDDFFPLLYGIEWSKPIGGNNDCSGHCHPGYGSYVQPEEITR